jgi:hypothetical protein
MIKISAETREMIVWLFNKFGERTFTFAEVADTISPTLFEKFKVNKFIIQDDLYETDILRGNPDAKDIPEGWRINWVCVGEIIKRRKKIWH